MDEKEVRPNSDPKTRGVVFSLDHPRLIYVGLKTQTRRRILLPKWSKGDWNDFEYGAKGKPVIIARDSGCLAEIPCPFGNPGDRIYVKEAWRTECALNESSPATIGNTIHKPPVQYGCDKARVNWENFTEKQLGRYRNARFMPRWASRTLVEVVANEAQELQEITEEDAIAEGAKPWPHNSLQTMTTGELGISQPYRGGYACLWDDLHEDATWKSNPPVWKVTMRVISRVEAQNVSL